MSWQVRKGRSVSLPDGTTARAGAIVSDEVGFANRGSCFRVAEEAKAPKVVVKAKVKAKRAEPED